ncbi:MAG TPA: protein ImuA [Allosphingosinicella sp.]|nr:protein ImuA [Allosphingosinicella sp.]
MLQTRPSWPRQRLDELRAEVRAMEHGCARKKGAVLSFGIDEMDRRLYGGGLAVGGLHEISAAAPRPSDEAAATLFAAGIAARQAGGKGTVLWVLCRRDLFAPGLSQAGLPPERLLYAECRGQEEALAAMEEGLRLGGLAAVVAEASRFSMTAARRLQLTAEASGTMALILRSRRRMDDDPLATPSAALTRWRIASVPSQEMAVADVERSRWRIELARQRGGEPYSWIMEGSDAKGCLALPAVPAHRASEAPGGEVRPAAA